MPRREQVGCCFPLGIVGGASSRSAQWERGGDEPKDEGILPFGSTGLGHDHAHFCQGDGSHCNSSFGSFRRCWGEEGREQGASSKEKASLPQEAKRGQGGLTKGILPLSCHDGSKLQCEAGRFGSGVTPHVLDLWCGDRCDLSYDQSKPGLHEQLQVDGRLAVCEGPGFNPLCSPDDLGSGVSPCKVSLGDNPKFPKKVKRCRRRNRLSPDDVSAKHPPADLGAPYQGAHDPWKELQSFSFAIWCRRLICMVLRTRTAFSAFLKTTLQASRSNEVAPANALFPLPIPKPGVFAVLPSRCASQKRRRVAFDRAFHIIVCALNFLHADCSFPSVDLMRKEPSKVQMKLLWNLRALVRAFGNSGGTFEVPQSGRRSIHLLAGLADLSNFVTKHGLSSEPYHRGFPGVGKIDKNDSALDLPCVSPDLDLSDQLVPYRPLQPDRLKLSGKANWDPCPFLGDAFLLPYREPALLVWTRDFNWEDIPDLNREDPDRVLELAKVWDRNGLLAIMPRVVDEDLQPACLRVFNCLKSATHDRQIGDRRGRNQIERGIPGPSRFLPVGQSLSVFEVDPSSASLAICMTDRKDFYHQMKVTKSRAYSNAMWPPLPLPCLTKTSAWSEVVEEDKLRKGKGREQTGDYLGDADRVRGPVHGKPKRKKLSDEGLGHVCFNSVAQGDHLGVEVATDSHRGFLKAHGLLGSEEEITSSQVWLGSDSMQGLVIDDFFSVSIKPDCLREPSRQNSSASRAEHVFDQAVAAYDEAGLLGSPEKDIRGASKAKIAGAEVDSSTETRSLGLTTLAAPAVKRLALSLVSLELAAMKFTTDSLHCCLVGGWTSAILFRRQFMSVLFHSHRLVDASQVNASAPRVVGLSRQVAQELTLLSVLCPLMTVDLAAKIQDKIYASDSSDAKGAYVSTRASEDLARLLWRTGSKKGGYARLQNKLEALARKLEVDHEPLSLHTDDALPKIKKPLCLRYDFIEICGGAAKVSAEMAKRGWNVGPCLDLDRSEHFDLASLDLVRWLLYLVEQGLLDSFFVQPPCTTFSPAAFPSLRSYALPYGFDRKHPRTKLGNVLAFRALTLLLVSSRVDVVGLLEQSRRSKMAWLPEWLFLRESGLLEEGWLASCMFGSPHQKEFRLLGVNIEIGRLHRKCNRQHSHLRIEGKWTKPSATYTDELACAFADELSRSIRRKKSRASIVDVPVEGLESVVFNDLMIAEKWDLEKVWTWKKPSHINIHEAAAVVKCLKDQALSAPRSRFSIGIDSHVALAALAKGRTPSRGLRPIIRRAGMITIVGSLYPAYHFVPTRLNKADHPTRNVEIPTDEGSSFVRDKEFLDLARLSKVSGLRRFASNWARLVLLLINGHLPWHLDFAHSWRFSHYRSTVYPYLWISSSVRRSALDFPQMDFDSTLGFPGEGPGLPLWLRYPYCFVLLALCSLGPGLCLPILAGLFPMGCSETSSGGVDWLTVGLVFLRSGAHAMDAGFGPRDARDRARAGGRRVE